MPEYSSSKIINHRLPVNNDTEETGIGCDMFIVRDLMVHLVLTADFKRQVLQWDGATLHMEEPISLIGQSFQLSSRCASWLCRLHNQLPHERLLNYG